MDRATQTEWNRRPPDNEPRGGWSLRRCPTKGFLAVVIVSHDLMGRYTHYFAGRTRPCQGNDCEACNKNMRPRWHGYLCAIDLQTNEKIIVEVTSSIASQLGEWFDSHRTLKGSRMKLERRSPKPNGKITCKLAEPAPGTGELPTAPDIRPIMNKIWEVYEARVQPAHKLVPVPLRATGTDPRPDDGFRPQELD